MEKSIKIQNFKESTFINLEAEVMNDQQSATPQKQMFADLETAFNDVRRLKITKEQKLDLFAEKCTNLLIDQSNNIKKNSKNTVAKFLYFIKNNKTKLGVSRTKAQEKKLLNTILNEGRTMIENYASLDNALQLVKRSPYEITYLQNGLISKKIVMIPSFDTTNIFSNDYDLVLGDDSFRACKINGTLNFSNAKTVGNNVFEISKIDTLKLPNIKVVGESSFRFLETKTELDLSSLTAVPKDCFESSKPKKLTIGILKSISDSSFRWFSPQIESTIVLSESITTIPRQSFQCSKNVKLIVLGNINRVGYDAFRFFQGQIFTFNRDIFINAGVGSDQVNDIQDAFVHDDILFTKNYLELENLGIPTNIMVNLNDPSNIFGRLKDKPVSFIHHIQDKYNVTLLPNNFYNKIETVEIIKDKYFPILQKEYLFEMTLKDLVSLKYRILKQYKNDIMKIDSDLLVGKTIVINDHGDSISCKMLNKIRGLFDSANNHENISNEVKSTQLKNK